MKPLRIYLVRHGESQGNADSSLYKTIPDWRIPLTEKGLQQALEAGNQLKERIEEVFHKEPFDFRPRSVMYYCSPHLRARQTATAIQLRCPAGKSIEDPRLREQEWGNFKEDGNSLKIEKERCLYGTFFYRMPDGESGADVYDRMATFIGTMHRDFEKDPFPAVVVIVIHGLTIKAFLMRWFHWSVEDFESYKTPKNCAIIEMAIKAGGKYELVTSLENRPEGECSWLNT